MDVTLPDGTLLKDIPDGTTKTQIATKLKASGHPVPDDWLKPAAAAPAPAAGPTPPHSATLGENLDIAASTVTGAGAAIVGGLAKAGGYVEQALGGQKGVDVAAMGDKLADNLTWSPKTDYGKKVMGDIAGGLQAFEAWSEKQGDQARQAILAGGKRAAEVAKSLGAPQSVVDFIDSHKDEVAAAYGAATKTAINAVPMVVGGELAKVPGKIAEVGERLGTPAPTPPPAPQAPPVAPAPADLTLAPSAPRTAPAAPNAPAATPGTPLSVQPAAPRPAPSSIGEGPLPAAGPAVTPKARAEAYVRDRLGLSWDALGNATKAKLERVANDARGLDRLNPEAVKRQAHLESLRVPIRTTAGRLSRDDAQLIKEEGVAGTNAGKPIRDIDIAANRDLRRNVEVLVDRLRGVGASRAPTLRGEKVGEVLAGRDPQTPGILTKRQRLAKAKTKAAYDEALKSEPDAEANGAPLFEYFKSNPSVQHVGWMSDWLNRAKVSIKEGETQPNRGLKLVELDDLRKKALKIGPTSPDFHYASDVIASIDEIMNDVPDSAVKWKAARAAHAAERAEFKNQGSIDRLVGTKGGRWGTDPKTDLEDVWKVSVKNASAAEVRQLKRSLLGGEDAATRLQGKQALRTVRAATAQNLLENITAKGISTNEAGEANITADSIGRWVKSMGQDGTLPGGWEKLEVIFGRKATRELKDILEAAQIVKTAPTTRVSGSNTFQNILNWMDDTGLGKVGKKIAGPVGDIAAGIKGAVEKPAIVRAAKESATSAAERTGGRLSDAETQRLQREQLRGAPPPTYRGEQP